MSQQPIQAEAGAPEISKSGHVGAEAINPKAAQPVPQNNPVPLQQLDKHSAYIECPFCFARAPTTVTYENTDATAYIPSTFPHQFASRD